MAKSHKLSFPISHTASTVPFQLVHMDVWGPSPVPSNKGYRYYLLVVDDFTRYTWLFPLHYKSEVKYAISNFKAYVTNQFHTTIQTVRSDNGGEFVNHFLLSLFLTHGVVHQTSCPHTPQQNGVVERKHRHLIETTITLLLQAQLPTKFWLEALTTAVYLTNRLPHTTLKFQVPYYLLFHQQPDYAFLKPFGCCCFPWLQPYRSNKLSPKSSTCVFLGYCPATKGYRCYDPVTTKVYVSRHVKFLESEFPYPTLVSSSTSTSSVSPTFHIPLTSFDDIQISILPTPVTNSSVPLTSVVSEVQHTEMPHTGDFDPVVPNSASLSSVSIPTAPLHYSNPGLLTIIQWLQDPKMGFSNIKLLLCCLLLFLILLCQSQNHHTSLRQ